MLNKLPKTSYLVNSGTKTWTQAVRYFYAPYHCAMISVMVGLQMKREKQKKKTLAAEVQRVRDKSYIPCQSGAKAKVFWDLEPGTQHQARQWASRVVRGAPRGQDHILSKKAGREWQQKRKRHEC